MSAAEQENIIDFDKEAEIKIRLLENKCIAFNITEYGCGIKDSISFDAYEFQFTINLNLIEKDKHVATFIECRMFEKQSDHLKVELANINASAIFHLENFEEVIKKDLSKGNVLIPNQLIQFCNGLTISSLRGMISVKLENTLFSNAIFPIIPQQAYAPPQIKK